MTHKLTRLLAMMLAVIMAFSMLLVPVQAASFTDVKDGAWYEAAVEYVTERGWMAGVSESSFAPNTDVTRGMMVTVLARLVGGETDNDAAIFADTTPGRWYTGPASWAAMNGIVAGVGESKFAPNRAITRQDLCLMLYKYIMAMGIELEDTIDRTFSDMDTVSEYASDAVIYCTGTGLIAGFEDSTFRPKSTATRAQLAQILMRLDLLAKGQEIEFMPAQSFNGEAGEDMGVSVSAPAGALPENTEMTVSRVTDEAYLAALEKQSGVKVAAAADITFTKDGAELEPEKNVEVQLSLDGMENLENPTVLHVRDDGVLEYVSSELISTTRGGSKSLRFQAKDFSVYIIGSGSTVELFNVTFYEPDGNGGWQIINKQAIRKDQVGEGKPLGNTPVYDPGVPSITETQAFEGWAESSTITDETVGKTVSNINAYVMENYTTLDQNEHSLSYYAIVRDVVFITYHDQGGVVIRLDSVHTTGGHGSYTVDLSYSPFKGGWGHIGWTPVINNTGDEPTYPENKTVYTNGQTIDVTGNLDLYPYLKEGYWLIFDNFIDQDADSTSASFTAPIYYGKDETAAPPTDYGDANNDGVGHDEAPYREGYDFGGWYTDKNLTTPYTAKKLTADTTVYAKWTPKTDTKYTVMIWTQKSTDAWNAANADKEYDFYKAIETRTGTTGQTANFLTADTELGGTADRELGYYFVYNAARSDTAGVKIKGDGTTVVNVRYDRRKLTFRFYSSGTKNYDTTHGSESELIDGYTYYINYDGSYMSLVYHADSHTFTTSGGTSYSYSDIANDYYIRELTMTYGSELTSYRREGLFEHELTDWPAPGSGNAWRFHDPNDGTVSMQTEATSPDHYISKVKNSEEWKLYLDSYTEPTTYDTIYYHIQQLNGTYLTYRQHRLGYSSGGNSGLYYDGFEFFGFKGVGYNYTTDSTNTSNGYHTWDAVKGDYRRVDHSNISNGSAHIYYERNQHKLEFFSNGESLTADKLYTSSDGIDLEHVFFDKPLAGYEPTKDPVNGPAGYFFDGWYKDPGCTEEFEWDINMPNNNMAVYAKWTKMRFRVTLDYTGGDKDAVVSFPGNQVSTFRVDYGEKLRDNAIANATREGYTLLGWYLDKAGEHPFNFSQAITDELYGMDLTYVYGSPGRSGVDPVNGNKPYDDDEDIDPADGIPDHLDVIGKLTIYALWRKNSVGADGVRIRYDAIEGEGYFAPVSDPKVIIRDDPNIYTDKAKAFAQPASTPEDEENYQFLYWVVMKPVKDSNGNVIFDENGKPELEETTIKVYPGQTFTVLDDYTVRTDAFKITWKFYDSTGTNWLTDVTTVTKNALPNHTAPSGYVSGSNYYPFAGWDKTIVAATTEATYTATYGDPQPVSTVTFNVTWKNYDGTVLKTDTDLPAGTVPSYTGTMPEREQDANYTYTFSGWTDGTNNYAAGATLPELASDMTYTATFDAADRLYTVTFHANSATISGTTYNGSIGGSSTYEASNVKMNTLYRNIFPSSDPTISGTGYFYGWYTAATGGTKIEGSDVFDGTTDLYAHWAYRAMEQDKTGTFVDGDAYVFAEYASSTWCYMNSATTGQKLTRTSTTPIPTTAQWIARASTSTSFYLENYGNSGSYIYDYTSDTDYLACSTTNQWGMVLESANTTNGTYYLYTPGQSEDYYVYYTSNGYSWSTSSKTAFYVYHISEKDANAEGTTAVGSETMAVASPEAPVSTLHHLTDSAKSSKAPVARGINRGVTTITNTLVQAGFEETVNNSPSSIPTSITNGSASLGTNGWTAFNAGSGNNWAINSSSAHAGSYCVYYKYTSNNQANCYLISSPFTVSSNAKNLNLSLYEKVYSSSYPETFEVFLIKASGVTTGNGVVNATKYPLLASAGYTNESYAEKTATISAADLAGESVRLVIRCTSTKNYWYLYIDDVTLTETVDVETVTYTKVDTPVPGTKYVIVDDNGSYALSGTLHTNSGDPDTGSTWLNGVSIGKSGNTIEVPVSVVNDVTWIACGNATNGWTWQNVGNSKYLNITSSGYLSVRDQSIGWLYDSDKYFNNQIESEKYYYLSFSGNSSDGDFVHDYTVSKAGKAISIYKLPIPEYAITWSYMDASGNEDSAVVSVEENTVPTPPPTAPETYTKNGVTYRLTGWSPEIVAATAAATYTAQYEVESYTITWSYKDASGNSTSSTTTVAPGATPAPGFTPATYTQGGLEYRFTGWSPEIVAATAPATYTAQYSSIVYTITWHYQTGPDTWTTVTTTVGEGAVPSYNTHPIWKDANNNEYMFTAWTNSQGENGTAPVAAYANAEYWAHYEKVGVYTYTMYLYAVYGRSNKSGLTHIFWYANNGTADNNGGGVRQEDLDLPINENTTIPTPSSFTYTVASRDTQQHGLTYVGHTFLGWARVRNTGDNDGVAHPELNSVDDCWLIWHDNGDGTGYYTVNPDNNDEASDVAIDPTTHVATVAGDELRPYHDLYAVWESHVFYVYHSSSGVLQAFDMPLNTASTATPGSMIGDFDITALVSDGYLYGGYYKTYGGVNMTELQKVAKTVGYSTWNEGTLVSSDWTQVGEIATDTNTKVNFEQYTGASLTSEDNDGAYFWTRADAYNADNLPTGFTAENINGKTMKPMADAIYYLKEVPADKYLHSYYTYVLRFNTDGSHNEADAVQVDELYLFTVVDDNNYKTNGVCVDASYTAAESASISRTALAPKFSLTQSGNANNASVTRTFTPNNLIQQRGYLSIYHPTLPSGTVTMIPSWKTLDGVTIGNAPLDVTVDKKTVTNSATTIPTTTNTKILYVNVAWHTWWFNDTPETRANFHGEGDNWVQKVMTQIGDTTYFYCEIPDNVSTVAIQRYVNGSWASQGETVTLSDKENCIAQFGDNQNDTDKYVVWKTYIP